MKLLVVLLPAMALLATPQGERPEMAADRVLHEGAALHGLGHARAKIGELVLYADEAVVRQTGALEMRGHVHITLPARADHTVVRYPVTVLMTDQPIGLAADRATVRNGLLEASGNLVVAPVDEEMAGVQLRGDEFFMFLRIGDATLRGHVHTSNLPADTTARPRPWLRVFPPEIIR